MKITVALEKSMLLGVSHDSYTSKKTNNLVDYYTLSIKRGGDIGQLSTTEEVYRKYVDGEIKDFSEYNLVGEYVTDYRALKVTSVHPVTNK